MPDSACLRRTVLAAILLAVAGGAPSVSAQGSAEPVLRVVAPWEYASNEPAETGYILARLGVGETLVQVEPDGRLVGGVARSWTVAEDGLTWRFSLRADARFHDGTPVTGEAVAASLRRAFGGESLSAVPLDGVAGEGDAVLVRTRSPFSVLPAFLADYAAIVLAPSAFGPDGRVARIVATGPYRLAAVDGKTTLELERFDAHARAKPAIGRVRYTAVPNGETRANIAAAGDADLVFTLAPTATPRIHAGGAMRVESLTIPRIRPIAFNSGLPPFDDGRVRLAVSLAIDRAGIAGAVLRHPASAATQLLPPLLADWHDPALPPLRHDPEAARRLLDEAGWRPGPDGIRSRNGVRLAVPMLTIANRPELPVMAAAIQGQLRQVGMEIAIEAGQPGAIPAAIKDGSMRMTLSTRSYVNVPEVIATIIPDYTRERSAWGTLNWSGRDRIKALTDAYVASFDPSRKAELRSAIIRIIHEEAPVVPVSWFEHSVAVSGRVAGVAIDPYELRYFVERIVWK